VASVNVTVAPVALAASTVSAVAVPLGGVEVTAYPVPVGEFTKVSVSEPVIGAAVKVNELPALLRPATGMSLMAYVVLAPNAYDRADRVSPGLATFTGFDVTGVESVDVVTAKVSVPVVPGALAVKSTSTLLVALMLHDLPSSMVSPEGAVEPAPAAPAVPAWPHEVEMSATFVGAEPKASDDVMVIESSALPTSAVAGMMATSKFVDPPGVTVPGEADTLAGGVPML